MTEYLNETLGLTVSMKPWDKASKLPAGLFLKREYYCLKIDGISMIVARIPQSDIQKKKLESYLKAIQKICDSPVVFWLDAVSTYQRKMLITEKIAFIVAGVQCYIPYLGMSFRERVSPIARHVSSFSVFAQLIVLYELYHSAEEEISQTDLSRNTGISPMAVSRGVRELEELGIVEIRTRGRKRFLRFKAAGDNLYEDVKDYMRSPVLSRHFVKRSGKNFQCIAGEPALAKKTMLNPPEICDYAVAKKEWAEYAGEETDAAWDAGDMDIIEVWKYDPNIFAKNGYVDPISLVLSFQDNQDERIAGEIKKLTETEKWYLE